MTDVNAGMKASTRHQAQPVLSRRLAIDWIV